MSSRYFIAVLLIVVLMVAGLYVPSFFEDETPYATSQDVMNQDDSTGPLWRSPDLMPSTEAEWKPRLTEQQFYVARKHGTERPFENEYWDSKVVGVYHCVCCGAPLFSSETKFKSGTGWPSFWEPVELSGEVHVETKVDRGFFSTRTEVHCKHCQAHLGHVFDDAPQTPTGLRYCMNSAAMRLDESTGSVDDSDQP